MCEQARQEPGEQKTDSKRQQHAGEGHADRGLALTADRPQVHLQTSHQQQHRRRQRQQRLQANIRCTTKLLPEEPIIEIRTDTSQHRLPEHDASRNFPDDRWLPKRARNFTGNPGHAQNKRHGKKQLRDCRRVESTNRSKPEHMS